MGLKAGLCLPGGVSIFRAMKLTRLFGLCSLVVSVAVAEAEIKVGLEKVVDGLTAPIILLPFNKKQMLLGEQTGRLSLLSKDGKLREFGDIKGLLGPQKTSFDERGLLGVALHPKFQKNHKLYVYYSAPLRKGGPEHWDHTSHVSEFSVKGGKLDLASERVLMQIDQPYFNHDGGRIAFGADDYFRLSYATGMATRLSGWTGKRKP